MKVIIILFFVIKNGLKFYIFKFNWILFSFKEKGNVIIYCNIGNLGGILCYVKEGSDKYI